MKQGNQVKERVFFFLKKKEAKKTFGTFSVEFGAAKCHRPILTKVFLLLFLQKKKILTFFRLPFRVKGEVQSCS